jgi:hypothetical protein
MGEPEGLNGIEADEDERIDYLSVVAAMAYAEHGCGDQELEQLRELCAAFEVSEFGAEVVVAAAQGPDQIRIDEIMGRLRESELRYALITDALFLAVADAGAAEAGEIEALAKALDVNPAQTQLIRKYVETQKPSEKGGNGHNPAAKKRAELGPSIEGAGVPLAAVGLTAMLGAPLDAGVSLAAWLGLDSFASVRWLAGRLGSG